MRIELCPLTNTKYFHMKIDLYASDFVKENQPSYENWLQYKASIVHRILSLDYYVDCFFLITIHDQVFEFYHQLNLIARFSSFLSLVSDLR